MTRGSTRKEDRTASEDIRQFIEKERGVLSDRIALFNKMMASIQEELKKCIFQCDSMSSQFCDQRKLVANCNMVKRMLMSCAMFSEQNKMKQWMIDDGFIEERARRNEK